MTFDNFCHIFLQFLHEREVKRNATSTSSWITSFPSLMGHHMYHEDMKPGHSPLNPMPPWWIPCDPSRYPISPCIGKTTSYHHHPRTPANHLQCMLGYHLIVSCFWFYFLLLILYWIQVDIWKNKNSLSKSKIISWKQSQ